MKCSISNSLSSGGDQHGPRFADARLFWRVCFLQYVPYFPCLIPPWFRFMQPPPDQLNVVYEVIIFLLVVADSCSFQKKLSFCCGSKTIGKEKLPTSENRKDEEPVSPLPLFKEKKEPPCNIQSLDDDFSPFFDSWKRLRNGREKK